ncbi:hypothetical protein ACFC6L_25975, partial [Kitasatospora phosalacinea]
MDSDNRAGARLADRAEDGPTAPDGAPGTSGTPGTASDGAPGRPGTRSAAGPPALWQYLLDDGLDPAGRIPVHAVRAGIPPADRTGTPAAPRPNPRHGRPLPGPAPAPADAPAPG